VAAALFVVVVLLLPRARATRAARAVFTSALA